MYIYEKPFRVRYFGYCSNRVFVFSWAARAPIKPISIIRNHLLPRITTTSYSSRAYSVLFMYPYLPAAT